MPKEGTISKTRIKEPTRLVYLDNIRWLMIVLVVIMHLKVTYGGNGLWYYNETRTIDFFSFIVFSIYGSYTQAFFMGILFFIAGYFVPRSYDNKGGYKFVRDRFIRLGIPALLFMIILHPVTNLIVDYNINHWHGNMITSYTGYISSFNFLNGSGPLWFAIALLIFSIIYAFFKFVFRNRRINGNSKSITHINIIALIIIIALFTFLLRIIYPVGPNAKTFFNMQIGNFSQYTILFIIGIIVYRHNLLDKISYKFGLLWFNLTMAVGIPVWFILLFFGGAIKDVTPFFSGFHWQSAAFAAWESFFCVGVCIGLLVICRKYFNTKEKISRVLAENSFGVYVFHPTILAGITVLFSALLIYPLLKMILMSIITIPICFCFIYVARKIPIFKRIFS
jgi:glucans biosynthesis protein C